MREKLREKENEFMVIAFLLPGIEGDVVSCLWYALVFHHWYLNLVSFYLRFVLLFFLGALLFL